MALDPALGAPDPLPGQSPQQALALVAVCGGGGRPQQEVVWGGGGDRVDQRLQGLFVHVQFLGGGEERFGNTKELLEHAREDTGLSQQHKASGS